MNKPMRLPTVRVFILMLVAVVAMTKLQWAFAQSENDSPVVFEELTTATLPWDAVPSPDGTTIYFTAIGSSGSPGVFAVPANGGNTTELAAGQPLAMPLGIAISADGQTLYVADPWTAGASGNAIFALPSSPSGGASVPVALSGTQGTMPQGIEVINRSGVDQLYFTGIDPDDGQPAVYTITTSDTVPTLIVKGSPLVAPSGITVAQDGIVYVLDRLASGNGLGSVFRVQEDQVEAIAENVRTGGQLAGLALTLDESLLLVSSLDDTEGTAQVLVIDLATMQTSIVNDVIGENTAAGGLHRARNVNQFAWADSTAGIPRGGVYGVRINN